MNELELAAQADVRARRYLATIGERPVYPDAAALSWLHDGRC